MEKENKKTYPLDWSDKVEPYTNIIAMGGDAIGAAAAATGVGAAAGGTIAVIGNVPNLLVDLYQTGRDLYRVYNDNDYGFQPALINGAETVLDLFGVKGLNRITSRAANFVNRIPIPMTQIDKLNVADPVKLDKRLNSFLANEIQWAHHTINNYEQKPQYMPSSVKQILDLETAPPVYTNSNTIFEIKNKQK
jgi:hypothetical protein